MRRKMSRERMSSDWSTGDCDAGSTALVIRPKTSDPKDIDFSGTGATRLRQRNQSLFLCAMGCMRLKAGHDSKNDKKEALNAPLQTPSR